MVLCMYGWFEVNNEGGDVKGEDEGDDPFENGSDVVLMRESSRGEYDGQDKLNKNKRKFDPKGRAKGTMVTIF